MLRLAGQSFRPLTAASPGHSPAGLLARLNLTVPATALRSLTGPGSHAGPWAFTPRGSPGPPDGCGTWTLTLPGGRQFIVRLDPVPIFEAITGTNLTATGPATSCVTWSRSATEPARSRPATGMHTNRISSMRCPMTKAGGPVPATPARAAAPATASSNAAAGTSPSRSQGGIGGKRRPTAFTFRNPGDTRPESIRARPHAGQGRSPRSRPYPRHNSTIARK